MSMTFEEWWGDQKQILLRTEGTSHYLVGSAAWKAGQTELKPRQMRRLACELIKACRTVLQDPHPIEDSKRADGQFKGLFGVFGGRLNDLEIATKNFEDFINERNKTD